MERDRMHGSRATVFEDMCRCCALPRSKQHKLLLLSKYCTAIRYSTSHVLLVYIQHLLIPTSRPAAFALRAWYCIPVKNGMSGVCSIIIDVSPLECFVAIFHEMMR